MSDNDPLMLVTVAEFKNRAPLLYAVVPKSRVRAFVERPEIAAVYWKISTAWTDSDEHREQMAEVIEERCAERMTPKREALARELLAQGEPLDSSTIRDRAQERGVSYGHGNALIRFLEKHAVSEDDGPSYRRRYTLPEADALAAEYEDGAGRSE